MTVAGSVPMLSIQKDAERPWLRDYSKPNKLGPWLKKLDQPKPSPWMLKESSKKASKGKKIEYVLQRKPSGENETLGELTLNGKHVCDTLEPKVREVKETGYTAIPAGRYKITITRSNRFKRDMPLLDNVKNFAGVRIHSGNSFADTEGCIIVGNDAKKHSIKIATKTQLKKVQHALDKKAKLNSAIEVPSVINSKATVKALQDAIAKQIKNGNEVWITVKDAPEEIEFPDILKDLIQNGNQMCTLKDAAPLPELPISTPL